MSKKIVKGSELKEEIGSRKSLPLSFSRTGVVSKEEIGAQQKGQKIIAEAEQEAARIRKEAIALQERIQSVMEASKKRGYEEGKGIGLTEFTDQIKKARQLKQKILEQAEPEIMKLVMAIAEKVIGELVQKQGEAIHAIVRRALEHSLGDRITIRIHPEDYRRLNKEDLQFKDILDRTKHLHFREDEAIEKGGCVVETEIGTIDAQLETQLKAIRKALGV